MNEIGRDFEMSVVVIDCIYIVSVIYCRVDTFTEHFRSKASAIQ